MVENKKSAEAFKILISSEITATDKDIFVQKLIGAEGWKMLAEGVTFHPNLNLIHVIVMKEDLNEASIKDIREIWDALKLSGAVLVVLDPEQRNKREKIRKEEGNSPCTRLAEISEMGKEEWAA